MRVAFLHPDLGLGGAERLVVDAAMELAQAGHVVDVFTAHYDPARCFEETRSGAFRVLVAGSWFPRHLAGRCMAACAYARCILVALRMAWLAAAHGVRYDAVVVDQVSVVIPFLVALSRARVLFYCHFPDLLLSTRRHSRLMRLYRAPLDWLEQATTGCAHLVLVNSRFTRGVFAATFPRLHARGVVPQVLHPAVRVPTDAELRTAAASWRAVLGPSMAEFIGRGPLLLSINRFERKKGLPLAIRALHELLSSPGAGGLAGLRLVLAGGYDARLQENVEHLQELQDLVSQLRLGARVRFLPSFSDAQRAALLAACAAVVYTPQHEHFGIVPLEAMAAGKPVVAVNSGGPVETVVHGETGLLCEPTPAAFAAALRTLLCGEQEGGGAEGHGRSEGDADGPSSSGVCGAGEGGATDGAHGAPDAQRMGAAARAHVAALFSREAFGGKLQAHVRAVCAGARSKRT